MISSLSKLRTTLPALTGNTFLRFFGASVLGLAGDVALAGALYHLLGLPLIASAVISLFTAATLMYFVHEFWTFRSANSTLSLPRMLGTFASALLAATARSACLYTSSQLFGLGDRFPLLQLICATALSFVLNYLLVQWVITGRSIPNRA